MKQNAISVSLATVASAQVRSHSSPSPPLVYVVEYSLRCCFEKKNEKESLCTLIFCLCFLISSLLFPPLAAELSSLCSCTQSPSHFSVICLFYPCPNSNTVAILFHTFFHPFPRLLFQLTFCPSYSRTLRGAIVFRAAPRLTLTPSLIPCLCSC